MNWRVPWQPHGWMKWKRPVARANRIVSRCPEDASRRNFLPRLWHRPKREGLGTATAPFLPGCVHFFWADERCVPPDDPESNFKLARELLFAPLGIPENQIHRIRGEDSPSAAVKSAEAELQRIAFGCATGFDLSGHGRGWSCCVVVSQRPERSCESSGTVFVP